MLSDKLEEVFFKTKNDETIIKKPQKDYKLEVIDYGAITTVTAVTKNYHVKHVFLSLLINLLKFIFVS